MIAIAACATLVFLAMRVHAQGVEVSGRVVVQPKAASAKRKIQPSLADIVVWLSPLQPEAAHRVDAEHPGPFRLTQKDKQFTPHLLVVPTGSNVEFPNKDPFFHNVFSLFNGKRFDLGLYESGTTRSVRFDREGVSYIFCNIHPEMGAIVLSLSTPYYGISDKDGTVTLRNVPPGTYHLHVWGETAQLATQSERTIQVGTTPDHLDDLNLVDTSDPMKHHTNKFGEDYRPTHDSPY
jgi:plastocyanin